MIKQKRQNPSFNRRTAVVTVFLFMGFFAIIGKLFYLQIINGKKTRFLAEAQHSIYTKLLASRGEIKITDKYSKEPYVVATNVKKPLIYAVPGEVKEEMSTALALASVLQVSEKDILPKFADKTRKYISIKKQITDEQAEEIKRSKLSGIGIDYEDIRVYPEGKILSQTLGFVGFKEDRREGLYGIERFFEKELAGENGQLKQEASAKGAWVFGSSREITAPIDGINIILTIDKSIQFKAESVIAEAVKKHGAESGLAIVVDPKTGAVMAMAGYPDFNPNEYNKAEGPKVFVNQGTVGAYEPGSIFKPLTMAAAINENRVQADTTYIDEGFVKVDGFTIRNSDQKAHGKQSMTQVLDTSLNTGAIFVKEQIGNEKFYEYVQKMGFGKITGIEIMENKGNLDNLKAKIKVNFHTASFGQGITATPIQIIQAYTAIANAGIMMKPYLVKSKILPSGEVKETQAAQLGQIISTSTADTVAAMMVSVVENGHGKRAGVKGYYIAGKTGTAQVAKKDGKGYEPGNSIGSFIGFGPVENPKFLMLVRIDNPKGVVFAESTAAPVFGEIAQFILNYLNISPSRLEAN